MFDDQKLSGNINVQSKVGNLARMININRGKKIDKMLYCVRLPRLT